MSWEIEYYVTNRGNCPVYEGHVKELLKSKAVRKEYEKLLPEYELAKSIIDRRLRKKMTQLGLSYC